MERKPYKRGKSFYGKVDFEKLSNYLFESISKDFCNGKKWQKKSELTDSYTMSIACARIHEYFIQIDAIKTDETDITYRMWIFDKYFRGCLNYATEQEAFADLYRIVSHDLEFEFADGFLTGKIYKYKTE